MVFVDLIILKVIEIKEKVSRNGLVIRLSGFLQKNLIGFSYLLYKYISSFDPRIKEPTLNSKALGSNKRYMFFVFIKQKKNKNHILSY